MSIEPIPLSEREKQTQKILDFAQDMYDDEDYNKYIWAVAKSKDGGKTFTMTAGRLPVGMSLTVKPDNEIAPISLAQTTIIEPTVYRYTAISASEFLPDHHPVVLLRTQNETAPTESWEAPEVDGKDDYKLTFDLGEERVVGCVEFWPVVRGKYIMRIGVSNKPADFEYVRTLNFENFGPATDIRLDSLVRARYVQLVSDCNEVKQVRILSMSENATQDEKVGLSHEFYSGDIASKRR